MAVCVSTEVMRASDRWTIENLVPSRVLMERAGRAIFEQVDWKGPVGIICGKGNNAGDGFVVASLLKDQGIECEIVMLFEDAFSEDGRYFYDKCIEKGIPAVPDADYGRYRTIVDCIFGTGFKGELKEPAKTAIEKINASGAYVVSADINSGLNGDTGLGDLYVISDLTVSIGTYKYGHFLGHAKEAMKDKVNCDIGIKIIGETKELS
ncbi:MAG: NAD(P)H-hydrate epimerase [Clostridiales bacterium]|jgi:NAD(P)H-hydrate epimerase|nr:NAD(P)H-hydrate epimerase [Clostridiales bacterium]